MSFLNRYMRFLNIKQDIIDSNIIQLQLITLLNDLNPVFSLVNLKNCYT